jgi:hypothetical protein
MESSTPQQLRKQASNPQHSAARFLGILQRQATLASQLALRQHTAL